MKILVTGATGFIGFHVANLLLKKGCHVIALIREASDASALKALGIELVRGDVRDLGSVRKALKGCQQLYHLAADYRLWVPDPETMYDINVHGTRNVMQAALKSGTEKVIYTGTVGTLAARSDGVSADETSTTTLKKLVGHYKRSKFMAEQEVRACAEKGLPVVIVNPSTPVGPMDRKPTPTGKIIVDFLNGRIPAYLDTGLNFIDVDDVAVGHWLASQHGRIGEGYIIGNKNITLREFFECLAKITGRKPPKIRLPYWPVLCVAYINEALSTWVTKKDPRVPLTGVKMARKYMYFDCSKALRELNIPQTPVEDAIKRAIDWFTKNGYVEN